ncbi:MAG: hypothetical protein WC753_02275 [Candidatus Gracilibacteria bacterium]|jgi:hypothetical protein
MRGDRNIISQTTPPWTTALIVIIALLFVILIWRFVSGGSAPDLATAPVSLRMTDATSSVLLTGQDKKEKTVQANTPLADLDLIEVKNGTAKLAFLNNDKNSLNLNMGTKIRYLGLGTDNKTQFRLENKDLWVQADTGDISLDLLGVVVLPASGSVLNIAKNELFTTITVLQGTATISIEAKTLEMSAGQQLNYSTLRTVTYDDLSTRIAPINPDTLSSPWMSLNGASAYTTTLVSSAQAATTGTGGSTLGGGLVLFESPVDESTVNTKTITVSGKVLNASVARLIISNLPATLDPVKQTFVLKNLPLTNHENNLIYRTYDATGTLLSKGFVTVYTTSVAAAAANAPVSNTAATTAPSNGLAQVSTYKPDKRFRVTAPAADYYETTDKKVRIEGSVSADTAYSVTINDFKLASFTPNGTSWYYFANQEFGNMQEGTNTYTIRYFDANGKEIYKQLFVIKKNPTPLAAQ